MFSFRVASLPQHLSCVPLGSALKMNVSNGKIAK
nr:MAG TPA: hypothetical protein [Caudoviricetes sp.]DAQ94772.1 MAG TPA: hypothetical protein [Caudoviricetes sp.]